MEVDELELLIAAPIYAALQAENVRRSFASKDELMGKAIDDARELRALWLKRKRESR